MSAPSEADAAFEAWKRSREGTFRPWKEMNETEEQTGFIAGYLANAQRVKELEEALRIEKEANKQFAKLLLAHGIQDPAHDR